MNKQPHEHPFSMDQSPGYVLNSLSMMINKYLQAVFKEAGYEITIPQWAVLNRLWEEDGISQNELTGRVTKDRHNLSRILTVMERNQLIYREADDIDKRLQMVFLTEKGRELKDGLVPLVRDAIKSVFHGITYQELQALYSVQDKVARNLGVSSISREMNK